MSLELVLGPMFSGKTDELVRRLDREKAVNKSLIAFKPKLDNRYAEDYIVSHSGAKVKAIPIDKTAEIYSHLKGACPRIIGIDEIQFFDEEIIDFCIEYANKNNVEVIASGLPLNFRREAFLFRDSERHIGEIMPYGHVTILRAKCTYDLEGGKEKCDKGADFTQRLVDGKPAHYDDPLILVGAEQSYAARCLKHHFVAGKDKINIHYWKE